MRLCGGAKHGPVWCGAPKSRTSTSRDRGSEHNIRQFSRAHLPSSPPQSGHYGLWNFHAELVSQQVLSHTPHPISILTFVSRFHGSCFNLLEIIPRHVSRRNTPGMPKESGFETVGTPRDSFEFSFEFHHGGLGRQTWGLSHLWGNVSDWL